MSPKVVVTNRIFPEVAALLAESARVEINDGFEPWPHEELIARCRDADALLAFMTDRVDAAFLAQCPKLRVVACALKGYDNFDPEACARAGVWLTMVPDLLTEPTAELAVGLAIALCRNVTAGDRFVRSGGFRGWRPLLYGIGLTGSAVGILGMGAVGRAIARRLRGFDAKVAYFDRQPLEQDVERALGVRYAGWSNLIEQSQILFVALPLTPETRHVVNEDVLRRLRPDCRVVNVGRGSVVDERAVAAALRSGRLAGYAADVFECEDWALADRPDAIHPRVLGAEDRTVLTPHIGSAVADVRRAIELSATKEILEVLAGRPPLHAVNRPVRLREPA